MNREERREFDLFCAATKEQMRNFADEVGGVYSVGQRLSNEDLQKAMVDTVSFRQWYAKYIAPFIEDNRKREEPNQEELEFHLRGDFNSSINVQCLHKHWIICFSADFLGAEKQTTNMYVHCPVNFTADFSLVLDRKRFLLENPVIKRGHAYRAFELVDAVPQQVTYRLSVPAISNKLVAYASDFDLGERIANDRFVRDCLVDLEFNKYTSLRIGRNNLPWFATKSAVTLTNYAFKMDSESLSLYLRLVRAILDSMDRLGIIDQPGSKPD